MNPRCVLEAVEPRYVVDAARPSFLVVDREARTIEMSVDLVHSSLVLAS